MLLGNACDWLLLLKLPKLTRYLVTVAVESAKQLVLLQFFGSVDICTEKKSLNSWQKHDLKSLNFYAKSDKLDT